MCETKMAASNGIDPTRLDPEQYVLSLIGQALQKGLLREADVQIFQTGCYGFLAELSRQWNGERSSSIRVEDAQMLTQSMLWLIGLVLKEQPAPEQALILLKRTPVKALYNEGLPIAQRKTRAAKIRWAQATGRLSPWQTRVVPTPTAQREKPGLVHRAEHCGAPGRTSPRGQRQDSGRNGLNWLGLGVGTEAAPTLVWVQGPRQ